MTVSITGQGAGEVARPADGVTVTIDGFEITVPKGTLVIRAAEQLGIEIPRFCDHPLLDPVGACRQCLVHIEGQPKPPASCTTTCTEGMVVHTQLTSQVAAKAQRGMMEFLLVNHPLDCPMCDKGGECPLQNQAMSAGQGETRFGGPKRTFAKPVPLSAQVLLDRERCIQCARCTRFSEQIAGDPLIELFERGPQEQIGIADGAPFDSYFSGNTVQICPVGALTGASYRFRARPFDLVSTPSVCEHCASGCRQRTDHRRGAVTRRLAGNDPLVNEEWNCDKGRWAFTYATQPDRLISPLVRDADGVLQPASWPEAIAAAAAGLLAERGRAGVLTGGRLTLEDSYAYAKFARVALASNDIDMRARPHSAEETQFLAGNVAGRLSGVTYAGLERASAVLLAGFEPQDESPIVFLRLRKAARTGRLAVYSLAAVAGRGLERMSGTLLPTVPGEETAMLNALAAAAQEAGEERDSMPDARAGLPARADGGAEQDMPTATAGSPARAGGMAGGSGGQQAPQASTAPRSGGPGVIRVSTALRQPGAVIMAGERLAEAPGALSAAARLAEETGARLAWVPRRAGERGAIEAGALPIVLPGGRAVTDDAARAEVARAWGVASLPSAPGLDTAHILAAAAAGDLGALVIAGVDPGDLPDPAAALEALERTRFLVSLELRASAVTDRADVVLPVAAVAEKAGTFVNWEGRPGSFGPALAVPEVRTDLQVLGALADQMDVHLGLPDAAAARRELAVLARGITPGPPDRGAESPGPPVPSARAGRPALATGTASGRPPGAPLPSARAGGPALASGIGHGPPDRGAESPGPPVPSARAGRSALATGTASGRLPGAPLPSARAGGPALASGIGHEPPDRGQALLATWHNLLDAGRMQDGEPNLAGTARAALARMSAATAAEVGVADGGKVTVATERGAITVPAEIADMPDRVVWLPTNSAGCAVRAALGAGHGSLVTLRSAL